MVGKIVVIFDGLEGGGFAEESEVVDGGGEGEERLEGFDHGEAGAENGD